MKLKINQTLKGVEGETLKESKGRDLTLKDILIQSLLTPVQGDDEKKKWDKYTIYKKLNDAQAEADLTIEEISTLKQCVGKVQPTFMMGLVWEILEGK